MSDMADKIKELRIKYNLTLEEVASRVGVGKSTVRKWETGIIANMRRDKIADLAKALHTTPAYLMGWEEEEVQKKEPIRVPVLGDVAAGIPIEAIEDVEDWEELDPEEYIPGKYAALRINGDSMAPRICDGDVVIVDLESSVNNGDIAIVFIDGESATCKKVKLTPDGIMLISINPEFEPMFFSKKQVKELPVTIWGKVVELRAKL